MVGCQSNALAPSSGATSWPPAVNTPAAVAYHCRSGDAARRSFCRSPAGEYSAVGLPQAQVKPSPQAVRASAQAPQASWPPQPSAGVPHVAPRAMHVLAGSRQLVLLVPSQTIIPQPPQSVPGAAPSVPQPPQALTGLVLHGRVSARGGQDAPPLDAGAITRRLRDCSPPPQVLLQADQAVHSLTRQSTAHGCGLQSRCSTSAGQAPPPLAGGMRIMRVRLCWPPPQDRLQVDQSPQSLTWQGVGTGGGGGGGGGGAPSAGGGVASAAGTRSAGAGGSLRRSAIGC